MSDSEGDIDDELLELAGATEKKRRKRQAMRSPTSKRRKADVKPEASDDGQLESEEDNEHANPYPLEGKYIDEADRQRLLELPEIEREDVLAERQEEMQRIQDKRNLDQMLKAQSGHGDENVSKAAKRQHTVRGATKEKSRKLDELKARRREKDERKRTRTNSPKRDMSSSPVDMEMSDEEEEDGQISRLEEEEDRERRLYDRFDRSKSEKESDEPATLEVMQGCRISRDMLAKNSMAPSFEDVLKGSWVRLLIGSENGQAIYRMCEVVNIGIASRAYQLDDKTVKQDIELKHGMSQRTFLMDKVSNGPFLQKEFDRLVKVSELEKVKLPTRQQLEKKAAQIAKFIETPLTESDINAMIVARKSLLQAADLRSTSSALALERSRLSQQRRLALGRQDWKEAATIEAQLNEIDKLVTPRVETREDILAKVNERNRKANLEAVRKAEMQEAERKRRERKLPLAGGGGTPRSATPNDAASRLKASNLLTSRPGTPGTPSLAAGGATPRSVSPLPPDGAGGKDADGAENFEASIIQSVDIDLGDF